MITISINRDNSSAIPAIEAHLERISYTDPAWSGAEFSVEEGDYTYIVDPVDQISGAQLLADILSIVEGQS